jgi:para-nitrobenzyl esterase
VVIGATESFKGIPYAAAPIGELRWRAPRPAAAWREPRSADDFGASCAQSPPPSRVPPGSDAERTSEDCLTLNIWAPATKARAAPVMVWIHGGGNVTGSGAVRYFDGTAFARDGVVLVTFNYRLGLFGFFAHPALTQQAGAEPATDFGLLDQIAALQWVRQNIAAFGGDPGNVTVFGESAGAADIVALMAMPAAKGLFQKAIVESAGLGSDWLTLSAAERAGANVANRLGLPGASASAQALRALPASALVGDEDELPGSGPVIDAKLLPRKPLDAFATGAVPEIPLMIGTNGNEGSLLGSDPKLDWAPGSTDDWIGLRALYGRQAESDGDFARLLFRDLNFAAPARWIAAHRSASAPTYLYRFDYVMSLLRSRRIGADHGSEVPFVFSTWTTDRLSDSDRHVTQLLHGCWIAFAKSGIPLCAGAPPWPAYRADTDLLMVFGEDATVRKSEDSAILDTLQRRLRADSEPPTAALAPKKGP